MQEDDIKKLMGIQGFSVARMDFYEEGKVPEVNIYSDI